MGAARWALQEAYELVKREWADIRYLRGCHDIGFKFSWRIESCKNRNQKSSSRLSYAYVSAGKAFDPSRQNVCAHTAVKGEERLNHFVE